MDNSAMQQPWGSSSAQNLLGQPSRSRSGSSGSDASHASSHSDVPLKTDVGAFSTHQPLASTAARNGSASGSGKARTGGAGNGRSSLDKGKGAQAPIAPGAAGQAPGQPKARRKRDGEGKRKKVAKACLVCQRSHLTCDESIADQCVEGVRKKAKYLMEGETEEPPDHHPHPPASISPADSSTHRPEHQSFSLPLHTPPSVPPPIAAQRSNSNHLQTLPQPTMGNIGLQDDIWLAPQMMAGAPRADSPGTRALGSVSAGGVDVGAGGMEGGEGLWGDTSLNMFANPGYDFGTSASNEYQMLDSMLNSMSPVFPFDLPADNTLSFDSMPQQQPHNPYLNPLQTDPSGMSMLNNQPDFSRSHSDPRQNYAPNSQQTLISPNWGMANQPGAMRTNSNQNMGPNRNGSSGSIHLAAPQNQGMGQIPWTGWTESPGEAEAGRSRASGSATGAGEMNPWGAGQGAAPKQTRMKTGAEVYHSVLKPFDYTEGYHRLMEHISTNYNQKEVLRVVKALAVFRPSLIALQMPMSEEDDIFLERSFQRTLIELEKLISYSATPTAVWRRTGELVYANPEFCGLIGKLQDELLTGRTYIYQLFAKQSAISYWENFSVHAFENTTQNFFQATTLEVGEVKLACSCCFTIRRDVFDLPSVVIGQFLPIPTDI